MILTTLIFFVSEHKQNFIPWRATGIYGYPQHNNKFLTCSLISNLSNINQNSDLLAFGDFNMCNNEKEGGNPIDANLAGCFKDTLNICDLQDLGYQGDPYTWQTIMRLTFIQSRLVRFLATSGWIQCFPNFINKHLLKYKSDHCPILLEFSPFFHGINVYKNTKKIEQVWLTNDNHINIVDNV